MADERITERDDGVTRERVVETSNADRTVVVERSGGGGAMIIGIVLLIAVLVGAYLLFQANDREAAETDAVTEAAGQVGEAAQQVGDSAEQAVDEVTGEQ